MKLRTFAVLCGMALPAAALAHGGTKGGDENAMFVKMDANGDGKLTPEEHTAAVRKKHEGMDTNKDGKVTAEEMTAAHAKKGKAAKPGMTAAEKIKAIDTDGDGALTLEEHTGGAKTMFGKMDTDKDGFLTSAEMAAGHAKLMKPSTTEAKPESKPEAKPESKPEAKPETR